MHMVACAQVALALVPKTPLSLPLGQRALSLTAEQRALHMSAWGDRRAVGLGAATLLAGAAVGASALEDDGAWARHEGPFTEEFFKDFQVQNGFAFQFVQRTDGQKPANLQKVLAP